jgi:hypothetical protein
MMLNLILSTIVFFIASWYIRRYLDEHEIPKGLTRGVLIFTLASSVSWGAWALVNWVQVKIEGPQTASQTSGDLSKLLKGAIKPRP